MQSANKSISMQTNDFSRLCGLSVCAFVRLCVIDVDFQSSNEPIFKIENGNNEVAVMMIVPGGVPPPSVPSYSIPFSRTSIFVVVVVVVVFIQKKKSRPFHAAFSSCEFFFGRCCCYCPESAFHWNRFTYFFSRRFCFILSL